jgi:hypothetical protein
LDLGSMELRDNMSFRICLISFVGMLEYMFVMSSDTNLVVGVIGVCFSWCINCVVLLMLKFMLMFSGNKNNVITCHMLLVLACKWSHSYCDRCINMKEIVCKVCIMGKNSIESFV